MYANTSYIINTDKHIKVYIKKAKYSKHYKSTTLFDN